MSTPRQFFEAFLQEKATAYAEANVRLSSIQTKYFGTPLLQRGGALLLRDPLKAVIEDVNESKDSATIITREPAPHNTFLRERYHLSAVGESWKIIRLDRQCFLCGGTGGSKESVCRKCDGQGWYDRSKK